MKNKIHQIEDLDDLKKTLLKCKSKNLIDELYQELIIFSDYKNAEDWNKAVRICESLTILGWGNYEPLQAVLSAFYSGNPVTGFYNRYSEQRFVDAIWSKRKKGYTMEQNRTSYFESSSIINKPTLLHDYPIKENIQDIKLSNQRNWIPKNPILIGRSIQNCYESSLKLAEDIEKNLKYLLDTKMQAEKYGKAVNRLRIFLNFSYESYHKIGNYTTYTQANYIIADESLKLKQKNFSTELKKIYSNEEINKNSYWLRNKFEIGPFRSNTGKQKLSINFDREFSKLSHKEQKEQISKDIIEILTKSVSKLKKKKLDYNFELMISDFRKVLTEWND